MINEPYPPPPRTYVRAYVPGDPARSTWVPASDVTPTGDRTDGEPSGLAHWLIVIGVWLLAAALVILGAIYVGQYVANSSKPQPTRDVQMPRPTPYPGGWNYGKP